MIRKEPTESKCAERLHNRPYLLRLLHAEMHFAHPRLPDEPSDGLGRDATAGKDRDASLRLGDQRPNLLRTLGRRRCATRRQHALDAEADEPLERRGRIGKYI